jgi:hypothetical protein
MGEYRLPILKRFILKNLLPEYENKYNIHDDQEDPYNESDCHNT